MSQTVLIAGGSGMIGRMISDKLASSGYIVNWLSRNPEPEAKYKTFKWDPAHRFIDPELPKHVFAIINLAGTPIAGALWTERRKQSILNSRLDSNLFFAELLGSGRLRSDKYLSAAAMGYYGDQKEGWITENEPPKGDNFLVACCKQWESAIELVGKTGINCIWFRIGLVLSKHGGALPSLLIPYRFGLALYFGKNQTYQSWIHINDLADIFVYALDNEVKSGVYNAAAPNPVLSPELAKGLKPLVSIPSMVLRIPTVLTSLFLGEMSVILLTGARLDIRKLTETAFEFKYKYLNEAVQALNSEK